MKNIIFIAPHGTGKGTQCDLLKEKYHFAHLSTGNLFREKMSQDTPLTKELKEVINSGKLVSDDIVLKMLEEYLEEHQYEEGIIFDGFPRTLNQAQKLDELMSNLNEKITKVIYLEITKDEALKRTLGRLICPNCGKSYNKFYDNLKPQIEGICDNCEASLTSREDDTKEAFESLFDVFMKDTLPILDYYQEKNILTKIDASLNQEEIFKEVEKSIKEAKE